MTVLSPSRRNFLRITIPLLFQIYISFLYSASMNSYAGFMVRELLPHFDLSEVGYFSGLLIGSFYAGQAVNGLSLGFLSDRFGVTAMLAVSAAGGIVFPIAYGLANSFTVAVLCSFLYGCLNGTTPLVKTRMHQLLSPKESQYALSYINTFSGLAFLFGNMFAAVFSYPADKYAVLNVPVLRAHPFLLPNVVYALFNMMGLILLFVSNDGCSPWHHLTNHHDTTAPSVESPVSPNPESDTPRRMNVWRYLWTNTTQVKLILICFALCCTCALLIDTLTPVLLMLPVELGGFGLATEGVAVFVLVVDGLGQIASSFLGPYIVSSLGMRRALVFCVLCSCPVVMCYPICSGMGSFPMNFCLLIFFALYARRVCAQTSILTVNYFMNIRTCPQYLATVNGIAQSAACASRFLGPSISSALFAWSSSSGLPFPLNQYFAFLLYGCWSLFLVGLVIQLRKPHESAPVDCEKVDAIDSCSNSIRPCFSSECDTEEPGEDTECIQLLEISSTTKHVRPKPVHAS